MLSDHYTFDSNSIIVRILIYPCNDCIVGVSLKILQWHNSLGKLSVVIPFTRDLTCYVFFFVLEG